MRLLATMWMVVGAMASLAPAQGVVETTYYQLATDLSRDEAREAYIRLDCAFEQFEADFAFLNKPGGEPTPRPRLKAVLCTDKDDYLRQGGLDFADGAYVRAQRKLLVYFQSSTDWNTVVHEACHQYIYEVVGGDWPKFFNEGVATYYGYSLFCGDSYLPGHVSAYYVGLNRDMVNLRKLVPFEKLFVISSADWNRLYQPELYHQSWTYVHYMLHSGDQNRQAFQRFVQGLVDGEPAVGAWRATVPDQRAFLNGWNQYWGQASVENEQEWRQRQIVLLTAAGVARVNATHGRRVQDLQAYFRACQAGQIELRETPETWLPQALLLDAAAERDMTGRWSLTYDDRGLPVVTLQRRGGPALQARYEPAGEAVRAVLRVERPGK